jgi:hypothetical protein
MRRKASSFAKNLTLLVLKASSTSAVGWSVWPGHLLGHSRACQRPQFGIYRWKKHFGRAFFAGTNRLHDVRNRSGLSHFHIVDRHELKSGQPAARLGPTRTPSVHTYRPSENSGALWNPASHYAPNGDTITRGPDTPAHSCAGCPDILFVLRCCIFLTPVFYVVIMWFKERRHAASAADKCTHATPAAAAV